MRICMVVLHTCYKVYIIISSRREVFYHYQFCATERHIYLVLVLYTPIPEAWIKDLKKKNIKVLAEW